MARYVLQIFFLTVAIFLAGCQAPQQPAGPTELCVEIPDRDQFIDRTLSLLRLRDFQPSFVDRGEALIVAGPTTSGQWFEPWRNDVIGPYQALEASLHTIRRTVSIEVSPVELSGRAAPSGPSTSPAEAPSTGPVPADIEIKSTESTRPEICRIRVTVDKARLSAPNRQATTAVGLLGIYSARVPTVDGKRGGVDEQWVPLGRDGLLEADLLRQISQNLTPVADIPEATPVASEKAN